MIARVHAALQVVFWLSFVFVAGSAVGLAVLAALGWW